MLIDKSILYVSSDLFIFAIDASSSAVVANNLAIFTLFLLLAFIPLAILVGYGVLVVAPIFSCFLAINSYKYKNFKEMYIWMGVGALSFFLALYMLGVI